MRFSSKWLIKVYSRIVDLNNFGELNFIKEKKGKQDNFRNMKVIEVCFTRKICKFIL